MAVRSTGRSRSPLRDRCPLSRTVAASASARPASGPCIRLRHLCTNAVGTLVLRVAGDWQPRRGCCVLGNRHLRRRATLCRSPDRMAARPLYPTWSCDRHLRGGFATVSTTLRFSSARRANSAPNSLVAVRTRMPSMLCPGSYTEPSRRSGTGLERGLRCGARSYLAPARDFIRSCLTARFPSAVAGAYDSSGGKAWAGFAADQPSRPPARFVEPCAKQGQLWLSPRRGAATVTARAWPTARIASSRGALGKSGAFWARGRAGGHLDRTMLSGTAPCPSHSWARAAVPKLPSRPTCRRKFAGGGSAAFLVSPARQPAASVDGGHLGVYAVGR